MNRFLRLLVLSICFYTTSQAQTYNVTIPYTCNFVGYGASEVVTFTGTLPNASGNGTLTINYQGDLDGGAAGIEELTFMGETGPALGPNVSVAPQCTGVGTFTTSIPMATLNAWASTGNNVQITTISGTNVAPLLAACMLQAAFCVEMTLVYPFSTSPDDAGISQVVSPGATCPGVVPFEVKVNNFGTNTLNSVTVHGTIFDGTTLTTFTPVSLPSANLAPSTNMNVVLGNYNFVNGTTYTIRSWTSSPNGIADSYTTNDTITINNFRTKISGTYSVGPGQTYTTPAAAIADLNLFGVCGPVVFNVINGTYSGQLVLNTISGASATNTITFNGNGSTITAVPTAADRHVIKFNGADYVTINNFIIKGTDPTYGWGVHLINSSDYNTINNCTIDLSAITSVTAANSVGIVSSGATTTNTTLGNNASYCVFSNNTIKGGVSGGPYYGINLVGNTGGIGGVGNQVINNTITDTYAYNIYLYQTNNTLVRGNDISRPTRTGVTTFYGVFLTTGAANTIVEKNRIHNTNGASASSTVGLYGFYISADATSGNENKFYNNLLYDFNGNGTIYGIYNTGSDGTHFHFNTFSFDHVAATAGIVYGFYQTTLATNIEFTNNIISITRGGTGAKYGHYFATSTSAIVSDRNNIYLNAVGGTQNTGFWNALAYATLGDWKTANSGAYDQGSQNADPAYGNPATGNFVPNGAAFNNIGLPIGGITTDFAGVVRNPLYPDPGALEFTPANDDAGILSIGGLSAQCPGNVTVSVLLKNYGVNNLSSAALNWTVNGVARPSINYIGSLGSGSATPYNLGTLAMVAGVSYDIVAWTSNPNGVADGNLSNDTAKVIGAKTAMAGTYTVGPAGDYTTMQAAVTDLNLRGICSAVVFNVVNGTYTGQLNIGNIVGTSATKTITFNGNGATITAVPNAADPYVVRLDGVDYLKMDNFTIQSTDVTYGWGVHLTNGANYNTINNCIIDITANTSTGATSVGIAASGSPTSATTAGNNASNCVFSNNTILGGTGGGLQYGITLLGNTGSLDCVGNKILNNTIQNVYTYNIYLSNTNNTEIRGNDISRATKVTVGAFYGITLNAGCVGTIMESNRIHNTHDAASSLTGTIYGIYFNACDAPTSNVNIAKNNLIYRLNGNGTTYAIYNTGSNGTYMYFNTISLDHTASTAGVFRGFFQTTLATDVVFSNNIISIKQGGSGIKHGVYYATNTSSIVSERNVIYLNSAGAGAQYTGFWNTNYTTMAAWKAGTTFDQNSDGNDPMFRNYTANNFMPNSFYANNIASPVSGITTDFFGTIRDAIKPDPGAIEFTPFATNDSCHQAQTIIAGIHPGSTVGTTADIAPACTVTDDLAGGVWYKYISSEKFVTVGLCGSSFDTKLRVFTGNCTTGLTCVTGNDDFCGTQSQVSFCSGNAITYYILVHGKGSATGDFTLTLTEASIQQATVTASAAGFCPGDTLTLTAGAASGYLWNDASSSTSQSISVTTPGSFNVIITDGNGCKDTSSSIAAVQYVVIPPIVTPSASTSFCSGDSILLSSSTASSYLWNDTNMTTTKNLVVKTSGTFNVYVKDSKGCYSTSTDIVTNELPLPVVDLGSDVTICEGKTAPLNASAPGLKTYFWSTGDTASNIDFTGAIGIHTITVTVTDTNGCSGYDEVFVTVEKCIGIAEQANSAVISVYPNPGKGLFKLSVSGFTGVTNNIRVVDFQGRAVHEAVLQNTQAPQTIDLGHLADGIYMLSVINDGQSKTMKLVIQ